MQNVCKVNTVVRRVSNIYKPYFITSLGVKMRNPINQKGEWIGWTGEEVAAHLSACKNYVSTQPPQPKENGRGC